MKRVIRLAPLVVIAGLAAAAFGQIVPGDPQTYPSLSIKNSPHDLNTWPGLTLPGNQICIPCHTPHNALKEGHENVLWNHEETTQTFVMYFGPGVGQPEGVSKMCLSCHDGVTAIDSYGGRTGQYKITGSANLGTNLSNDHPIGVEYVAAPGKYNDPANFAPGIGFGRGVKLVTISGKDRVECSSCHEPHNNGLGTFLPVPLEESYICLQCHIK